MHLSLTLNDICFTVVQMKITFNKRLSPKYHAFVYVITRTTTGLMSGLPQVTVFINIPK